MTNLHRELMDSHLGLDSDEQATEMRLLLSKALTALRMSRPVNERSAQQIRAARSEITQVLRRAA